MFGIGTFELLILVVVGGVLLALVGGGFTAIVAAMKSLGGLRTGHATLNCPHCGTETPAADGKCRQCGELFV